MYCIYTNTHGLSASKCLRFVSRLHIKSLRSRKQFLSDYTLVQTQL